MHYRENIGYTPNNLKELRHKYGLMQERVAEITGVTLATEQKREVAMGLKAHCDMPHTHWLVLLEYLGNL